MKDTLVNMVQGQVELMVQEQIDDFSKLIRDIEQTPTAIQDSVTRGMINTIDVLQPKMTTIVKTLEQGSMTLANPDPNPDPDPNPNLNPNPNRRREGLQSAARNVGSN